MRYSIHTDGGARGNPGPAAIGVVIKNIERHETGDKTHVVFEFGKTIGEATNNVAEYTAVIEGLKKLKTQNSKLKDSNQKLKSDDDHRLTIQFFLDSTLVVNQLNGIFKIKNNTLLGLMMQVRELEQEVGGVITYTAIPREQNTRADYLVNKAFDGNS